MEINITVVSHYRIYTCVKCYTNIFIVLTLRPRVRGPKVDLLNNVYWYIKTIPKIAVSSFRINPHRILVKLCIQRDSNNILISSTLATYSQRTAQTPHVTYSLFLSEKTFTLQKKHSLPRTNLSRITPPSFIQRNTKSPPSNLKIQILPVTKLNSL